MGRQAVLVLLAGLATACGSGESGDEGKVASISAPVSASVEAQLPSTGTVQGEFPVGHWILTRLRGEAVESAAGLDLAVLADGRFSGSGGCNRFFGNMKLADGRLAVGPVGSTMMACEEAAMDLEHQFLGALEQVTGFGLQQDQLLLQDAQGGTLMAFVAQPAGDHQGQ
jgi:heat shock protein HslJ